MMKRLAAVLAASLLLAGCSGPSDDVEPSSTAATTTSSTSESPVSSTSESSATATPSSVVSPVEQAIPEVPAPAAEPTIVECLEGTPGPSLMSDGTVIYTDYCFHLLDGPAYLEQESQSGLYNDGPSNTVPYYDTSGEAQAHHGCREGYIDDPVLCGKIYEKYGY